MPGIPHVQGRGVADDFPDSLVTMDEGVLAPARIETDAEAPETGVTDVLGDLSWSKRLDTRPGESSRGQGFLPLPEVQSRNNPARTRPAVAP